MDNVYIRLKNVADTGTDIHSTIMPIFYGVIGKLEK